MRGIRDFRIGTPTISSVFSLAENVGLEFIIFDTTTVVFVNNLEERVNVLSLN
jgi:hypothetical protein